MTTSIYNRITDFTPPRHNDSRQIKLVAHYKITNTSSVKRPQYCSQPWHSLYTAAKNKCDFQEEKKNPTDFVLPKADANQSTSQSNYLKVCGVKQRVETWKQYGNRERKSLRERERQREKCWKNYAHQDCIYLIKNGKMQYSEIWLILNNRFIL